MNPLSICFVAPMAYPVLAQDRSLPFAGGAEVQQVGIATALARRGHRVSMICHDHGFPDGESIRGVRVFRMCAPSAGMPVVRFVHPRLTSLWSAMRRADADVYYQRTSGAATAFVAAFAQRHGRASIFAGAHDADFEPDLPLVRLRRDKLLYRWGVRNVSRIVAQTDRQQRRCKEVFGRDAVRIDSCYAHAGLRRGARWRRSLGRHGQAHEAAGPLPRARARPAGLPLSPRRRAGRLRRGPRRTSTTSAHARQPCPTSRSPASCPSSTSSATSTAHRSS